MRHHDTGLYVCAAAVHARPDQAKPAVELRQARRQGPQSAVYNQDVYCRVTRKKQPMRGVHLKLAGKVPQRVTFPRFSVELDALSPHVRDVEQHRVRNESVVVGCGLEGSYAV